jgi:hypothetical protein
MNSSNLKLIEWNWSNSLDHFVDTFAMVPVAGVGAWKLAYRSQWLFVVIRWVLNSMSLRPTFKLRPLMIHWNENGSKMIFFIISFSHFLTWAPMQKVWLCHTKVSIFRMEIGFALTQQQQKRQWELAFNLSRNEIFLIAFILTLSCCLFFGFAPFFEFVSLFLKVCVHVGKR